MLERHPYWPAIYDDWSDERRQEDEWDRYESLYDEVSNRDVRRWKRKSWKKWDKPAKACKF